MEPELGQPRKRRRQNKPLLARKSVLRSAWDLFGSGGGKFENAVVDRRVRLGFVDDDLLFIGRAFRAAFDRERNVDAVDFFVVADVDFILDLSAVLIPLRDYTNFEEVIRI